MPSRSSMLMLAAGSLAVADAFMAPAHSSLALRSHHSSNSLSSVRRPARSVAAAPKMQLEQVAEHATLLAAYPEGFVNGMTAYFNLYTPIFKSLNLPPFMLHWFHALNMATVLFAMGGYGTYIGWHIRNNPGEKMNLAPGVLGQEWTNLGKSSSEMHATLMTAMAVIFFLGANGGIVLSLVQDKPITEVAHDTYVLMSHCACGTRVFKSVHMQGTRCSNNPRAHRHACAQNQRPDDSSWLSFSDTTPHLQSVHFTTAMIGFAMLAAQGSITKLFNGANDQVKKKTLRAPQDNVAWGMAGGLAVEESAPKDMGI